jgi:valyl-tRNA synthetase
MLGDTAIAVSPKDERFSSFIGKTVILPIVGREIPIIADAFVDPEFGTGAVKVTPAHDFDDYDTGLRHNLQLINILTPDGKINENGKEFQGLPALEARFSVVKKMQSLGLVEKIEPYKLRVGISYRSKAVIEPFLSEQWFVKMTAFKEVLRKAVEDKKVLLVPSQWEQVYYYWIDHLRDWCISRQLWWGHQIPIWYNKKDPKKIICFDGEGLPEEVKKHPEEWNQDEDVLDTWFSSALWPFSVMGWPNKTEDFQKFYPTSTLVTGHDILFFWVARMILMAEYCTKNIPFEKVFIHGLIYGKSYWTTAKDGSITYIQGKEKEKYDLGDPIPSHVSSRWEKMSKSKGNVIDPLELIDSYGTDAVRMTLASAATGARQIDLDRRRFDEYKNFANKLWNATRFVLQNLEENKEKNLPALTREKFSNGMNLSLFTLEDFWILSKVNRTIVEMNQAIEDFCFDKAVSCFYSFFWNEFCSYYLELVKPNLFGNVGSLDLRENKQKLLLVLLGDIVRMLHPIMPFITEEIFSYLKALFGGVDINKLITKDLYTVKTLNAFNQPACIVAAFPQLLDGKDIRPDLEEEFSFFEKLIYAIRNIRAEMQIPLGVKTDVYFIGSNKDLSRIKKNQHVLQSLVKVKGLIFEEKKPQIFGSMALVENIEIHIPLPEEFIVKEKERLSKEKEKLIKLLSSTEERLKIPDFVERAPKELVEKTKDLLEKTKAQISEIEKKLKTL